MGGTRAVVTPRTFSRHKKRAHPKGKSFPCKSAIASFILGRQTIKPAGSPSTSTNQTSFSCSNGRNDLARRSEEHTSELQSLMRISYAVFCLKKKKTNTKNEHNIETLQNNETIQTKKYTTGNNTQEDKVT